MNIADPWQRLYISVRKKCITCLTSDKIVDFAEVVYRQIPSLTSRHHLCLYTNKPRVLQGITMVVDCFFYLCLSAILFWEAVTQMWWELYEIWVKKQHRQEGMYHDICLPAYKYCLCQRLSVRNGLWKTNNKQFIVGRSGSSEVLRIWISTILYFATVTAICGPRRWSTLCKNQWSVSRYVTIIQNLGS